MGRKELLVAASKNENLTLKPNTILNKRPMGQIVHPINFFKPIFTFGKSYDNIIKLLRRGKTPLSSFRDLNGPYFENIESPSPKDALLQD